MSEGNCKDGMRGFLRCGGKWAPSGRNDNLFRWVGKMVRALREWPTHAMRPHEWGTRLSWMREDMGREAGFSAALLTEDVSSFGRNDTSLLTGLF